jgi:hypothetical protein
MTTLSNVEKQTSSPPSARWQVILTFFAFILIGAYDGAIGVLLPSIRALCEFSASPSLNC